MRLDQLLEEKRGEILRIASEHGAREVRVFGSVARGEADQESDIDFLVELEAGRSPGPRRATDGTRIPSRPPGGRRDRARAQGAHPRARAAGSGTGVRDPKERLLDILDAIAAIERYRGRDKAASSATSFCRCGSFGTCRLSARRPVLSPKTCERWLQRYPGRRSSGCGTSWSTGISTSTPTWSGMR